MNPLLTIAIAAAREAGSGIMQFYASSAFDTKDDGSPITLADRTANEILIRHLNETGIQILSEESEGVPLPYPSRMWIIDPMDGTIGFIKKTDDFAVMIGLIENGRPILGVVYAPVHDTLYYAETGTGAFVTRRGETTRLTVSTRDSENLRFLCSANHFTPIMQTVTDTLGATLTPQGSVGLKAGKLAEAEGDFFFSPGKLGEWDVCAPEIIATEAGGRVTDFNGAPLFYGTNDHRITSGSVFSNGACHEKVLNAIRSAQ